VPIILHRATSAAELADILKSGEYRLVPGGVEGKYFCLSLSAAQYFQGPGYPECDRDRFFFHVGCCVQGSRIRNFDQRPGVFENPGTLPMVNSDARRFNGIRRVE
jgi:hypothetical protein